MYHAKWSDGTKVFPYKATAIYWYYGESSTQHWMTIAAYNRSKQAYKRRKKSSKSTYIEFTWNNDMVEKKLCDTQHMLYLLQQALDLVRRRTIERNKYFKSIGRTDRYISQLDNPQIITNFLKWHLEDKENNKFDGQLLERGDKIYVINDVIANIGSYSLGQNQPHLIHSMATKIYTKLKKDVWVDKSWLQVPQPKLKLQTWGVNTKLGTNHPLLVGFINGAGACIDQDISWLLAIIESYIDVVYIIIS